MLSRTISSARSEEILEILAAGDPAAFATDTRRRVIFWNRGAENLLGRPASEVLGRRCYDVVGARDIFGNRFCYERCPIVATAEAGEPLRACELVLDGDKPAARTVGVTTLRVAGLRSDLFTLVHLLEPVDEEGRLARALERAGGLSEGSPADAPPRAAPSAPPLTPRETEILRWVAEGLQNKEIAQELDLSLATVRNHIHNMLEKLDVHSKLEAVSLAFHSGWVETKRLGP